MYPKLFFAVFIFLSVSCRKHPVSQETLAIKPTVLFSSKQDAFEKIASFLSKEVPGEQLIRIDNISYIQTLTKTMALVFYETNTGKHNLVYTSSVMKQEVPGDGTITVCEGDDCACRVRAIIDNQGNVTVSCSCSSCEMITTEL